MKVGDGFPVRVAGVVNVSPESFYKNSVKTSKEEIERTALKIVEEGASFIDVGAASTAPYLPTAISIEEEKKRVEEAIETICDVVDVPISVDTENSEVLEAAIANGASILNDVSGFKKDKRTAGIVAENDLSAVIMARKANDCTGTPIQQIISHLNESLEIAREAGVNEKKLVVDPGIGFFRNEATPWFEWDASVLKNLNELTSLDEPILVAVSRKSFIGEIAGVKNVEDRLAGSLSATAIAVLNGAHAIRTHDVKETIQAVKIAEKVRKS
ncbi:dihydropteroate synthase [Candidatus Micrarchaeota archaeon]|nr:dihydropteroate synthase [Candidatus Micrarchaeota archaeon]